MTKFLRPNKSKLKNAQHYSLMEAFRTVLTAAALAGVKLQTLVTAWMACFEEENRCYMVARASEIIKRRDEADKLRDKLYTKLHALVKVWLDSGNASLEAAAEVVIRIFRLYKVNTQAQLDEQTGQMDNLIIDLSTQEMQAHLETLGAMWLFNQMVAAHNQVKSIRLEEGLEVSEKVVGALESARKASDAAYDQVTAMIEALSLTADDTAPYEAFIKQWNGTLKIYQDMLDRKSGSSSNGQSGENNGNGSENGNGTAPENGGGTNSGTEEGGEQGGTSNNGQNGQSGENNGSGSENGGGSEQGGSGSEQGGGLPPSGGGEVGDDNGGGDNGGGGLPSSGGGEVGDNSGGGGGGLPGSGGEG